MTTEAEIRRILEDLSPTTFADEVQDDVSSTLRLSGAAAISEVGLSTSFSMISPRVVRYLDNFAGDKSKSVTRTTQKILQRELVEGVKAGEGPRPLARRVRESLALSRTRSTVIARTEVHNAASAGRLEGYKQSGVVAKKRWKTNVDGRQRDSHLKLHNTVKDIDDFFRIGSAKAKTPGTFGVAKEDIQCRCTIIPIVDRGDMHIDTQSEDEFFALVARRMPTTRRSVERAFAKWQRQIIRGLRATS